MSKTDGGPSSQDDATGENLIEQIAAVGDYLVAVATYHAAVKHWPKDKITLATGRVSHRVELGPKQNCQLALLWQIYSRRRSLQIKWLELLKEIRAARASGGVLRHRDRATPDTHRSACCSHSRRPHPNRTFRDGRHSPGHSRAVMGPNGRRS